MRQYTIARCDRALPELYGLSFDPEIEEFCEGLDYAPIENYVWDASGYCPEGRAYVTYDDEGLHVLMCACEETISARVKDFNGPVCTDSCLEFFLKPIQDDDRYLNIEINAAGTALIGLGADRFDRKLLAELPEFMNIRASRHRGGWWAVACDIPWTFIEDVYGRRPQTGQMMRGNFYKCDETIHPHFGSWAPVQNAFPDFHLSKWFGDLMLG